MARLSEETQARIRALPAQFPDRRSAVIPAMHYAQADAGCLEPDVLLEVAQLLELPANATTEVVGFYTMFDKTKPGTYKLEVCRNLSCALLGAEEMTRQLEKRLGCKRGESTADGKFTLLEVECLGACGYAPMMMIGPYFYENLDREKVDAIVEALARDQEPPVPPAGYRDEDGEKPVKGSRGAVPTSSEAIARELYLGPSRSRGNGAGGR